MMVDAKASGETSPDSFYVNKKNLEITRRDIVRKLQKLSGLDAGGTILEAVPDDEKEAAAIDDTAVCTLARYGLMLEERFNGPQDVEWAIDQHGDLFILQSRPLGLVAAASTAFIHDKRFQRATVHQKIETGGWYRIRAEISGHTLKGYLNDVLLIEYTAERPLGGYVGLWTKADSVTCFDVVTILENGHRRIVTFQIDSTSSSP
jgi:hypothetical protein